MNGKKQDTPQMVTIEFLKKLKLGVTGPYADARGVYVVVRNSYVNRQLEMTIDAEGKLSPR